MIGFTLSEKEFDYELQALATGFFPGKRTQINGESGDLHIAIDYGDTEISVCVETKAGRKASSAAVTGDDDWHKKEGKLAHPYRTYYKNIVNLQCSVISRKNGCRRALNDDSRFGAR